jgi:hypothetical protein
MCDEHEDTAHLFLIFPIARFLWSAVRELLGCSWNQHVLPTFIDSCNTVKANPNTSFGSVVMPFVGPFGTFATSLPLKGFYRTNQLMHSINYLCIYRCGGQWLGDRTER